MGTRKLKRWGILIPLLFTGCGDFDKRWAGSNLGHQVSHGAVGLVDKLGGLLLIFGIIVFTSAIIDMFASEKARQQAANSATLYLWGLTKIVFSFMLIGAKPLVVWITS